MKRVMWSVLVLVALVLAAFGASSYWFGLQTEREYHAMVQKASDWKDFQLTSESYTRGIFSSEARTIFELIRPPALSNPNDQNTPGKVPLRLMLTHQISHGPVPSGKLPRGGSVTKPALAVIETRVSLDPKTKEQLKGIKLPEGMSPTMDITTILYWAGESENHVRVQPFRGDVGVDTKVGINFTGLDSQFQIAPDFKQLNGTTHMETLELVIDKELTIQVKGMKGEVHQARGSSGFYLGDALYSLDLIDVKHQEPAKAEEDLSLKGLQLKSLTSETGNDLSSTTTFSIGRLAFMNTILDRAVFELELRKLDSNALSELQSTMKKLQQEPGGTEQLGEKNMMALLNILPKLLKNSPELEIKQLGFASETGEVRANATLKVDGKNIQEPLSPPMLMNAMDLEAAVSVPQATLARMVKSFAKEGEAEESSETEEDIPSQESPGDALEPEIQSQLGALVAQKFILLENGIYKTSARYAGGRLSINGQPINLDQLLGP